MKGDHQGPLSRAIKGRMFPRNMRVGPGNFPGPVTDGSAARGRTTNRPVFLSPRKLYLVYMGLSRKEDIRRGFHRLRAASDFALGGKVTKTPLGTAPLIKGRCRAQRDRGDRDLPLPSSKIRRAGQCPAPTKGRDRFLIRRRGGPMWPPIKPSPWGEGAPVRTLGRMRGQVTTHPFVGAAHWAALYAVPLPLGSRGWAPDSP